MKWNGKGKELKRENEKENCLFFSVFWVIEERRYSEDKRDKMGLNFRVFSPL